MTRRSSLLSLLAALAACQSPSSFSTAAQELQASSSRPVSVLPDSSGRPQMVSGRFAVEGKSAEEAARHFLAAHAAAFHLDDPQLSLSLSTTREGLTGTFVRFDQLVRGAQVFDGEVVVLVSRSAPPLVLAATLAQLEQASQAVDRGDVGEAQATQRALTHLSLAAPYRFGPKAQRGIALVEGRPVFVWRVRVATQAPVHDWQVLVEAATGEVLATRDRLERANGTGMVFDANPVASTGTVFADNNDATSAGLDAARFAVTLPRLDGSGVLRGPYVDASCLNAAARATDPGLAFNFTRSQSPSFEEVNVYFHLDRVQNRIQVDLGELNVNNRQQLAIVDGQSADNSNFSASPNEIIYGTGGIDDAEDAEIVVHEYGHAVQHDQVPNWGAGGDEGAMGEGFGDYLAASMLDVLANRDGHAQVTDVHCLGDWDALAYVPPATCLRRTDSPKHNPEAADGEVHDDGEMWSASLWALRDALGADATDKLVLESQFLLSGSASFEQAVTALLTADSNLNAGAHTDLIRHTMIRHGLSRALTAVPNPGVGVLALAVSLDNPRAGGVYAANLDHSVSYQVPGAQVLRVHFSRIDTERNSQCFAGGCDNLYLTNGAGDLFQVLNGTFTDLASSPILGDTVTIRLVSDTTVNKFGYHVDHIDVLGDPDAGFPLPDGGVPYDAGLPDGGPGDAGVDAGPQTPPDAGPLLALDAGLGKAAPTPCGCDTPNGGGAWGLALLVAAALVLSRLRAVR